ncbi:MAG TPA: outer membrane beta-barrel protein [Stellaceae bacterium]|nr:outer membrane beta-barrel protein [Stellaceae bacterium]
MSRTFPRAAAAAVSLGGMAVASGLAWAEMPAPAQSAGLSVDPTAQLAQAPPTAPPPPGPAAAPPAPPPPGGPPPAAPAGPTALTTPSMAGPIAANPNPIKFEAGPLGSVYVSGFASGLALFQSNAIPPDSRTSHFDVSNGQVAVQKTDGLVQFYAQAGAYSLPTLGFPYFRSDQAIGDYFSALPVGYLKLVPNDAFSVSGGKLPTLIGAEYTFTFQNMNIERGLLWGLEPAISRGVQGNYTWGPVAFALSLNDGYYSGNYNWLSGSAAWTISPANTLTFAAGGNFGRTSATQVSFPANTNALNNSDIFNVIYTYNNAPWTITPYFQYTHTGADPANMIPSDASTYGGAILASYAFTPNWSLAGRFEAVGSTGSATNLLYGPGSNAWSLTLTPTYQEGIFFARAEGSFVKANDTTPGLAFGRSGNATTQARVLVEVGVVF